MRFLTPARLTVLMLGTVGCLVGAYVVKSLMAVEEQPRQVTTRNIPMPVADLEPGTVITEEHLGQGPHEISGLTPDILLSNRVITGRVVKEKLIAARPIRAAALYELGASLPLQTEPGMRAVTIEVQNPAAFVDGLVKPGQYVDVHFTPSNTGNDPRLQMGMTITLFKGVRLLAVNRTFRQGKIENLGVNSVTLELTPAQSNVILLARERGAINLSFNPEGKGTGGVAVTDADRVTLDQILGLPAVAKPVVPEPFLTQIYRGNSRSEQRFLTQKNRTFEVLDPSIQSGDAPSRDAIPSNTPQADPDQPPQSPARSPRLNSSQPPTT